MFKCLLQVKYKVWLVCESTLFSIAPKQTEVGYLHSCQYSNNRCGGHCSASVRTVSDVHYCRSCSAPSVISGVLRFLPVVVFHTFR